MERDDARLSIESDLAQAARAAGATTTWAVYETYHLQDRILSLAGDQVRLYPPSATPEVVFDLAKLATRQDEETMLGFMRRWGLLGQARLLGLDPGRYPDEPEHVDWVLAQARAVRLVLELLNGLRNPPERQRVAIEQLFDELMPLEHGRSKMTYGLGGTAAQLARPEADAVSAASNLIRTLVNANIDGVTNRLATDDDGIFSEVVRFRSLSQAVWWQVLRMSADRSKMRRCAFCGALFDGRDPRRKYCPRNPLTDESESRCGRADRARRGRAKRRNNT